MDFKLVQSILVHMSDVIPSLKFKIRLKLSSFNLFAKVLYIYLQLSPVVSNYVCFVLIWEYLNLSWCLLQEVEDYKHISPISDFYLLSDLLACGLFLIFVCKFVTVRSYNIAVMNAIVVVRDCSFDMIGPCAENINLEFGIW